MEKWAFPVVEATDFTLLFYWLHYTLRGCQVTRTSMPSICLRCRNMGRWARAGCLGMRKCRSLSCQHDANIDLCKICNVHKSNIYLLMGYMEPYDMIHVCGQSYGNYPTLKNPKRFHLSVFWQCEALFQINFPKGSSFVF